MQLCKFRQEVSVLQHAVIRSDGHLYTGVEQRSNRGAQAVMRVAARADDYGDVGVGQLGQVGPGRNCRVHDEGWRQGHGRAHVFAARFACVQRKGLARLVAGFRPGGNVGRLRKVAAGREPDAVGCGKQLRRLLRFKIVARGPPKDDWGDGQSMACLAQQRDAIQAALAEIDEGRRADGRHLLDVARDARQDLIRPGAGKSCLFPSAWPDQFVDQGRLAGNRAQEAVGCVRVGVDGRRDDPAACLRLVVGLAVAPSRDLARVDLKPALDNLRFQQHAAGKERHKPSHADLRQSLDGSGCHALRVKQAVLAVDEGTSGVTALVVGPGGSVLGRSYREVPQSYPKPGWVEQDPALIWRLTRQTMDDAVRAARHEWADVAAIGITNQRETTVLWDRRTGKPVAPAIVWQDRRTAAMCARLKPHWGTTIRRRTGLVLDPYFSATKLQWLLRDERLMLRAKAGRLAFGTIDAWLAWNITGRHVTDVTNASRTMLMDLRTGEWDQELLDLFGVPEAVLPEIVPSAGIVARGPGVQPSQAAGWQAANVPVAGIAGDQQAALFGQGCTRAGEAKNTYGTGCFLLQHTGQTAVHSRNGLVATRAASTGRAQFALEGSVFTAGAAIQWLRDQLGMIRAAPEVDRLAADVPDAAGVHVVPAFTGLGAPHWDPEARGAVLGLTRGVDRRHLARATLEGIAFQSAEVVWAMEKDSAVRVPRLRVDGGASQSAPLIQFQADLLQRPVARPANVETTALGAAMLAGIGAGVWSMDDVRRPREGDHLVKPRMAPPDVKRRLASWRKAVKAVRAFGLG